VEDDYSYVGLGWGSGRAPVTKRHLPFTATNETGALAQGEDNNTSCGSFEPMETDGISSTWDVANFG
jgi:hypothetical protein